MRIEPAGSRRRVLYAQAMKHPFFAGFCGRSRLIAPLKRDHENLGRRFWIGALSIALSL
jgi:hypothetical protein